MNGVAAKGRGMSHSPGVVRRNISLRQRTAPKSLRIPALVQEYPDPPRDEVFSPQADNVEISSMSLSPVQFLPGPDTLRSLEIDSDSDTETTVSGGAGGSCSDLSKTSSRPVSCLTDFSNYLDTSQCVGDVDDVAVNHAAFRSLTRESTCEIDSYGWETEYDRKDSCRNADSVWRCRGLGYHRTASSKQRLLHRVLSLPDKHNQL